MRRKALMIPLTGPASISGCAEQHFFLTQAAGRIRTYITGWVLINPAYGTSFLTKDLVINTTYGDKSSWNDRERHSWVSRAEPVTVWAVVFGDSSSAVSDGAAHAGVHVWTV